MHHRHDPITIDRRVQQNLELETSFIIWRSQESFTVFNCLILLYIFILVYIVITSIFLEYNQYIIIGSSKERILWYRETGLFTEHMMIINTLNLGLCYLEKTEIEEPFRWQRFWGETPQYCCISPSRYHGNGILADLKMQTFGKAWSLFSCKCQANNKPRKQQTKNSAKVT